MSGAHPTTAEINLSAFSSNIQEVRKWLGDDSVQIIPVIKADAYGHGAVEIAKRATKDGIKTFGVCNVDEGVALRKAGINATILILGGVFEGQEEELITSTLQPVLYTRETVQRLAQIAQKHKTDVPVHIKIDTGMGRLGFHPDNVPEILQIARETAGIAVQSLMTHFASAYTEDRVFTEQQITSMKAIQKELSVHGISEPWMHLSNSAGTLFFKNANFNAIRPGLILYGARPAPHFPSEFNLSPVMRLVSKIVQIKNMPQGSPISYGGTYITSRPSRIAVIPIGYADGYSSRISNKGKVLLRGKRVSQVGTVCMDMCMIDITSIPEAQLGDEVVLIGAQGDASITVEEVANWSGVIPYEVLCMIGKRVKRKYIE